MNSMFTSIVGGISCIAIVCGLAVLSTEPAQPVVTAEPMGPEYIVIPEMTTVCTTAATTTLTTTLTTTAKTEQTTEFTTFATVTEPVTEEPKLEPIEVPEIQPMVYVLDPEPMPEPSVVPETEAPLPEPPFVDSEPTIETEPPAETEPVDVSQLTYVKRFSRGTYYHTWGSPSKGGSGRWLMDCSYDNGEVKGSIASSYLYNNYGYNRDGRTKVYLEVFDKHGVNDYSSMNGWYYVDDCDAWNPEVIDFYFMYTSNCPFEMDGVVDVECYI